MNAINASNTGTKDVTHRNLRKTLQRANTPVNLSSLELTDDALEAASDVRFVLASLAKHGELHYLPAFADAFVLKTPNWHLFVAYRRYNNPAHNQIMMSAVTTRPSDLDQSIGNETVSELLRHGRTTLPTRSFHPGTLLDDLLSQEIRNRLAAGHTLHGFSVAFSAADLSGLDSFLQILTATAK